MHFFGLTLLSKNGRTSAKSLPCSLTKIFLKKIHAVSSYKILAEIHLHCQSFYSPTDAQLNCLKNNFKIYIKTDIKTAPTCFGSITIIRERITRAC
jgi:hypothetical protein